MAKISKSAPKTTAKTPPKTKAAPKAKKTETAKSEAPKAEAAKTDAASSDTANTDTTSTDTAAATTDGDSDSGGSGKTDSGASRPISYFSSVSTDDYRSGWDGIFSSGGSQKPARKNGKAGSAKRSSKLPMTLTLDADDLDAETRTLLEDVLRKQAKKKRLNYDKLSNNGQVSWQISCRISSA